MKKNVIKLNETQLSKMIAESVKMVLKETDSPDALHTSIDSTTTAAEIIQIVQKDIRERINSWNDHFDNRLTDEIPQNWLTEELEEINSFLESLFKRLS